MELTPTLIAMVVGAVISLTASYVPGFRTKWAAETAEKKQTVMALLMIGAGVVVYVLACTPWMGFAFVACPAGGIWQLAAIIIGALTSNQVVDRVSPDTSDVKAIKAAKKATS